MTERNKAKAWPRKVLSLISLVSLVAFLHLPADQTAQAAGTVPITGILDGTLTGGTLFFFWTLAAPATS